MSRGFITVRTHIVNETQLIIVAADARAEVQLVARVEAGKDRAHDIVQGFARLLMDVAGCHEGVTVNSTTQEYIPLSFPQISITVTE